MAITYIDSFASYLEDLGVATRGQDLYIGEAPRQTSDNLEDGQWWIVPAGGNSDGTDFNQWQRYLYINVFYRDRDPRMLYEKFEDLRTKVAESGCPVLEGYECVRIEVSSELVDNDVDTEENKTGVMVIRLTVTQKINTPEEES